MSLGQPKFPPATINKEVGRITTVRYDRRRWVKIQEGRAYKHLGIGAEKPPPFKRSNNCKPETWFVNTIVNLPLFFVWGVGGQPILKFSIPSGDIENTILLTSINWLWITTFDNLLSLLYHLIVSSAELSFQGKGRSLLRGKLRYCKTVMRLITDAVMVGGNPARYCLQL